MIAHGRFRRTGFTTLRVFVRTTRYHVRRLSACVIAKIFRATLQLCSVTPAHRIVNLHILVTHNSAQFGSILLARFVLFGSKFIHATSLTQIEFVEFFTLGLVEMHNFALFLRTCTSNLLGRTGLFVEATSRLCIYICGQHHNECHYRQQTFFHLFTKLNVKPNFE